MKDTDFDLTVIGGGLAGCEAAWQAAERGKRVALYEMRPMVSTGAHTSSDLAELVCSNSLGSNLPDRASGLLKNELRRLDSLLMKIADQSAVPAGGALAVDRHVFSRQVSECMENHPRIKVIREEVTDIPDMPCIIASGPLTSPDLSKSIMSLTHHDHLYFYDAIAPIIGIDSINLEIAFRASRYCRGVMEAGDYINCPMTKDEYESFIDGLLSAKRIELKSFELDLESGVKEGAEQYFEGCLPVEILAKRGRDALAFGPMKPIGLIDPRNGRRPYALVQLRQDNLAGTLYNMVGFQTNLTFSDQKRVFRMIPGLEHAEFIRYGQMHRNTFIFSPALLRPSLQFRMREDLFFAGQITGVEGYCGNIATGLVAGWNAARVLDGVEPLIFPPTTLLGALCHYVTHARAADFQPMKANFGILPALDADRSPGKVLPGKLGKRERAMLYADRSRTDLQLFLQNVG